MKFRTKWSVWTLAAVLALGLSACGKNVERVGTRTDIDLSGRWNDADSRRVADSMIEDTLQDPWHQEFSRTHGGDRPIVIAYGVKNRTAEHINTNTFMKDLERAFIRSRKVRVVADSERRSVVRGERAEQQEGFTAEPATIGKELGANFVLTGEINDIRDRAGGEMVVFYQTNLELINVETNEIVWLGEKEIKKLIDVDAVSY